MHEHFLKGWGCGETSFGPGSDVMRLTSGCKADTAVNIVGADRGEMGFWSTAMWFTTQITIVRHIITCASLRPPALRLIASLGLASTDKYQTNWHQVWQSPCCNQRRSKKIEKWTWSHNWKLKKGPDLIIENWKGTWSYNRKWKRGADLTIENWKMDLIL